MIITDPAGGTSIGPRFGYSSRTPGMSLSPPRQDAILLMAGAMIAGGALPTVASVLASRAFYQRAAAGVRTHAHKGAAAIFSPINWSLYNIWSERGELMSILRGEEQTIELAGHFGLPFKIRPAYWGPFGNYPGLWPYFDLNITPKEVHQEDVKISEEIVSIISKSPGNSSQVLPAGSVSPGGTPLGWIPVITTERKRRKRRK